MDCFLECSLGRGGKRCAGRFESVDKIILFPITHAISVTERAQYIGRIRNLSRTVAQAYVQSREALGYPMLNGGPTDRPL